MVQTMWVVAMVLVSVCFAVLSMVVFDEAAKVARGRGSLMKEVGLSVVSSVLGGAAIVLALRSVDIAAFMAK